MFECIGTHPSSAIDTYVSPGWFKVVHIVVLFSSCGMYVQYNLLMHTKYQMQVIYLPACAPPLPLPLPKQASVDDSAPPEEPSLLSAASLTAAVAPTSSRGRLAKGSHKAGDATATGASTTGMGRRSSSTGSGGRRLTKGANPAGGGARGASVGRGGGGDVSDDSSSLGGPPSPPAAPASAGGGSRKKGGRPAAKKRRR